ncbi:GguC family protein [soil metagenome]
MKRVASDEFWMGRIPMPRVELLSKYFFKRNCCKVYNSEEYWKLLPSFDHPGNPLNCIVSGTGLTHKTSALNRQMMHQADEGKQTDSMQIYHWGLEGGQPKPGAIGVQPEWFYKGTGVVLKAHGDPLEVPSYANDGGEEPEVAGIYVVDKNGSPWRIGFSAGNEFSDHVMEKKNYLYLAPSKLRNCSLGPELVINMDFQELEGEVSIIRNGKPEWSKIIKTGEVNMAHSLANLEYHHFKYEQHRIPLQAHVHFFGADAFSFGNQVQLQEGDLMNIHWEGMGRALSNPIKVSNQNEEFIEVKALL